MDISYASVADIFPFSSGWNLYTISLDDLKTILRRMVGTGHARMLYVTQALEVLRKTKGRHECFALVVALFSIEIIRLVRTIY